MGVQWQSSEYLPQEILIKLVRIEITVSTQYALFDSERTVLERGREKDLWKVTASLWKVVVWAWKGLRFPSRQHSD